MEEYRPQKGHCLAQNSDQYKHCAFCSCRPLTAANHSREFEIKRNRNSIFTTKNKLVNVSIKQIC